MKNEQEKFNRLKDAGYNIAMSLAAETKRGITKKRKNEKTEELTKESGLFRSPRKQ